MMTALAFMALCIPVALTLLAAGGLRVLGWGTLAIGSAGILYSFVGNPGLQALAIIPASGVLILSGIVALVIRRRQTGQRPIDPPAGSG